MKRKAVLRARYSRTENDFVFEYPAMIGGKQNASFVNYLLTRQRHDFCALLSPIALSQLEERGFDTKGIVITIPIKLEVLVEEGTNTPLHPQST